jgi:ATP-dependent helicase/nuclease subunit A
VLEPRGARAIASAPPVGGPAPPPPVVSSTPGTTVSRVSYSGLESYRRCGYRFYLERTLGLSSKRPVAGSPAEREELDPVTRGALAHELLERVDFRRPAPPAAPEVGARLAARGIAPRPTDVDALRGLVEGFLSSELSRRMGGARTVRAELPFAYPLAVGTPREPGRSVIVEGVIDALCRERDGALLVDYKSDRVGPATDLERLCRDEYGIQRLVYALAALRDGAAQVDVAHAFLERPNEPVLARFEARDRPRLEQDLRELVGGLVDERFEPAASPGRELCSGCPGRAALCSWSPECTGGPLAGESRATQTRLPETFESSPARPPEERGSVRPAA